MCVHPTGCPMRAAFDSSRRRCQAGRRPGPGAHAFPVDRSLYAPTDGRRAWSIRQSPEARRRDDRARCRRGDREPASRFWGRRPGAERVRLARACRARRSGAAQAASRPETALARPRPIGQSGATAMVGLVDIARIKAGETVVVSAAAGAVGSAVGQIARIKGCRAIGIAGGPQKCRHVVADLGFDDCIDYKAGPIDAALARAAPQGVDIYFDNVGGDILDAVLPRLNMNARVPVCGQISQYNRSERPESRQGLRNVGVFLDKCVMLQGFRIGSHLARRDQALDELMDGSAPAASNSTRRLPRVWRRLRLRSSTCCPAAISASRSCGSPRPPSDAACVGPPISARRAWARSCGGRCGASCRRTRTRACASGRRRPSPGGRRRGR